MELVRSGGVDAGRQTEPGAGRGVQERDVELIRVVADARARPGGKRDIIFLHGVEPQLKWKTFCAAVLDVAHSLGAEMALRA